jgi:hypothetical protein
MGDDAGGASRARNKSSEGVKQSLVHPDDPNRDAAHAVDQSIKFGSQPTKRLDIPKPPSEGTYAVPGPGAYTEVRLTRRGTKTNHAHASKFGSETQRPDLLKEAAQTPGPNYNVEPGGRMGWRQPPMFTMSPRVWAAVPGAPASMPGSARMQPYQPPLGPLPCAFGRQVEGQKGNGATYRFTSEEQRPAIMGRSKMFLGKEMEGSNRGNASIQAPCYVAHESHGLYRSTKHANSPRMTFSKESRF